MAKIRTENKRIFNKVCRYEDDIDIKLPRNYIVAYVHGTGQEHDGYCSDSTSYPVDSNEVVIGETEITAESMDITNHGGDDVDPSVISISQWSSISKATT